MEIPASVPSIAARGVYFRMVGPMNAPANTTAADDERPGQTQAPSQNRIVGLEIHGQHDQEHDDEHMRNARSVRERRNVIAAFAFREFPGHPRVEKIADRQRDAQRRQNTREHDFGRQFHDAQAQARQHDDVEQHVGEEAEKAVPIAGDPRTNGTGRTNHCGVGLGDDHLRLDHTPTACGCSAATTDDDSPTQPKMPPCAAIMRNPIR